MKQTFYSIFQSPGNRGYRLRALWRSVFWFAWKRAVARPITIRLANDRNFKCYPDCVESSLAFMVRWPDWDEIRWIRQRISPEEIFIDVGANVGLWSLLLADLLPAENLMAFEPGRIAFQRLSENFRLNQLDQAHLHNWAIGRNEGMIEFPDYGRPEVGSRVGQVGQSGSTTRVKMMNLDGLTFPKGKKIGCLKIDVEGHEAEVLAGASEFLKNSRPAFIIFECLNQSAFDGCSMMLRNAGYRTIDPGEEGTPGGAHMNRFAVPIRP